MLTVQRNKILSIGPPHLLLFIIILQKVLGFGRVDFTRTTNIVAIEGVGVKVLYIVFVGGICYVIFRLGPHFEGTPIMVYIISKLLL